MTAGHTISTAKSNSRVEVKLDGEVLADTRHPILLDETGLPTRYYLPREDVRMDLLEPTTFHTTCPFKGEASYWSANIGGERQDGIVWSYESPLPAVTDITGYLSFYPDRVQIIVDGENLAS
ncbi:MAG TPA: DUF427 domain-containing protein [Microthrixaceae bacterium]|nr:DUF427 domain-containing protein [Microthrixaceae bacterium]